MGRFFKSKLLMIMIVLVAIAGLSIAAGCGEETTTTAAKTDTVAAGGKVYVAVTGAGELSGEGQMGYAVVDLATDEVEMVTVAEAKAPHGIIWDPMTATAPDTSGRVATEMPTSLWLGNAEDGKAIHYDFETKKLMHTATPPTGAKLAICGMELGPDDETVWLASMGDGKMYPLNTSTGTIGEGVGGAPATTSICGIAWSSDEKFVYVVNMFNPDDPTIPGYVAKLDWPSGQLVSKIENVTAPSPTGAPLAHQAESTPDKKFLYVTDGVEGQVVKIDMTNDQIVKRIDTGYEPHAIVFSADGETAYIAVRGYPDKSGSGVFVMDVATDQITKRISGITQPLICGLVLDESG